MRTPTATHAGALVATDHLNLRAILRSTEAETELTFPDVGGRGRIRCDAARIMAFTYGLLAKRPIAASCTDGSGHLPSDPAEWRYEPRRLLLTGPAEKVARFAAALPGLLAELERRATIAARRFGRWLRTGGADGQLAPCEHRLAARQFRAEVFTALASGAGHPAAELQSVDMARLHLQAAAFASTLGQIAALDAYTNLPQAALLLDEARWVDAAPPGLAAQLAQLALHYRGRAAVQAAEAAVADVTAGSMAGGVAGSLPDGWRVTQPALT